MPYTTYAKTRIKMFASCSLRFYPSGVDPPFFCFQIRIQGYNAVVQMSKEQPGWVERNVDVLVQLLQSGESLFRFL
jgi:hypothetical protein